MDLEPLKEAVSNGARAMFDALYLIWGSEDAYGIFHDLLENDAN